MNFRMERQVAPALVFGKIACEVYEQGIFSVERESWFNIRG